MAVGRYRQSAVFQPFTFEQMIKPYQIATEAYNTAEKDLNEQLDKYATIEAMADDTIQDRIEQYKNFVNDTNDKIASGNADYREVLESARRARDYYRDNAPKIAAAYDRQQADLKMYKEMKLKNPNYLMTKVGSMADYMDNPNYSISGLDVDAMNARMVKSGEMISSDLVSSAKLTPSGRAGLLKEISEMGIDPVKQAEYYSLASKVLTGTATQEENDALFSNPVYSSLLNSLSSAINESNLDRFDDATALKVVDGYLRNQIEGIKYNVESRFISDPSYVNQTQTTGSGNDKTTIPGWYQIPNINSTRTPENLKNYFGNSYEIDGNGNVQVKSFNDFLVASTIGKTQMWGAMKGREGAKERVPYSVREYEKIFFNENGDVRTPSEMNEFMEKNKKESYSFGYYPKQYTDWYNQLKSAGVDLHTNNPSSYGGLGKSRLNQLYDNVRLKASSIQGPTSELETAWARAVESTDQDNVKTNLIGAASKSALKKVDKDENGKNITSETMGQDDGFFDKNTVINDFYYDENDNTIGWTYTEKGKPQQRVQMDMSELGINNEARVNNLYNNYIYHKSIGNDGMATMEFNAILNIIDTYHKRFIKLEKS